jgi:hypothetical protein
VVVGHALRVGATKVTRAHSFHFHVGDQLWVLLRTELDDLDETKREVQVGGTEDADAVTNAAHDLPVHEGKSDSDVNNEENDDESFDVAGRTIALRVSLLTWI